MTKADPFNTAYSSLNKNQRLAVDSLDGPVMVIAGPGTGKTQVLTTRIANILKNTDTDPSAILALTFTDAATENMRRRLLSLIGTPAYFVQINTFHSFCQSVIRDHPEIFSIGDDTQALSDLERLDIFQSLLLHNNFELIKPLNAPFLFLNQAIEQIKTLKREHISPDKFLSLLKQEQEDLDKQEDTLSKTAFTQAKKDLTKNFDLHQLYLAYQQELSKRARFDFEDMINFVVDNFNSNPDLLLSYQENLQYILVDEYQDTNSAQNELVFKLASFWDNPNLFVVGDPNQSIFRFQGASLENSQEFISRFPKATIITLTDNYRSTSTILDSASSLIANNPSLLPHLTNIKLKSHTDLENQKIIVTEFPDTNFEDSYILSKIKELAKSGTPLSHIAIIAKENQDLMELGDSLKRLDLPFVIQGGHNLLTVPTIKQFLHLLKIINLPFNHQPDPDLFTLLSYDVFGLDPLSLFRATRLANDQKTTLVSLLLKSDSQVDENILLFFNKLISWQQLSHNKTLPEFFQLLLEQSGFLNHLLSLPNSHLVLADFVSLFDHLKSLTQSDPKLDLALFLKQIDLYSTHHLKLTTDNKLAENAITLTTIHKAKGLEWPTVFLYRCVDGSWGNTRNYSLFSLPSNILEFGSTSPTDKQQEQRRLFYVALTRAKNQLFITSARSYPDSSKATIPSLFISELPQDNLEFLSPSQEHTEVLQDILSPVVSPIVTPSEQEYLRSLLQNFKLSVTALNTYLQCAYKFKLNDLYKVPRAKEAYLSFGTAVHKALELFHKKLITDQITPSKEYLLNQFEIAIKREVLSDDDLKERLKQGLKVLGAYYDFYKDDFLPALFTEKYFGYTPLSSSLLDDTPLVGKIDRIDIVDHSDRTVKVVDYKTGSPKTRGEIEGTTKNSDGAYKRQLVFYQLLTDLDKRFPYPMVQAELDFVEPDSTGKFKKEVFSITKEEVQDLKQIVKATLKDIKSFKFDRTTNYTICHRCEFKDHCWPQGIPTSINL